MITHFDQNGYQSRSLLHLVRQSGRPIGRVLAAPAYDTVALARYWRSKSGRDLFKADESHLMESL